MAGTRRRIEVEVLVDSRRVHAGFAQATASTNQFVRGVERTSRGAVAGTVAITGMGRAIAFASAQFLGGYGLLYGLSAAVRSAISFQQAMVLIQTQAGGTAKEVQRMTGAVLKLAPSVGDTPNMLAQGLYHVESSGIRGAKALDTLRIAAEGAKLGGADLESVTSALVAAEMSGIKGAQNLGQAMGALDAIIGTGNMRMEDLAHALSSGILTSAKAFGVGLNDIGAALSVLTVQGVPAQLAATRLRTSLSFLAAGTPAAQRALEGIGLTTHKLGETLRHGGMVPALELISAKLRASGLDATDQAAVLTRAFGGARTATTIITLLQNIDQVSTHLNAINVASHNFAAKWAAEQKTAQFATDKLKATVVAFADNVGLSLLPTVDRVSNSMSHWLSQTKNQERIQRDMNQAVSIAKSVATDFYRAANFVAHTLGGWHDTVELLIGLKLASWIVNAGEAAFKAARYMWSLATAEQAVAAASGQMTAANVSGAASAAARTGMIGATSEGEGWVAGTAAAEAGLYGRSGQRVFRSTVPQTATILAAQRAAATQLTGEEGFQFASGAAQREAAIAAMQTGATGFGGAAMLRTAGGEREVLNAERLRLLQSQLGEGARVTEQVAPGFAGAVRPAMFAGNAAASGAADSAAMKYLAQKGVNPLISSGEGMLATGAAFSALSKPVEEMTPRFAGLIKMFPALGAEITSVSGALGSAGLAAAAGFASYELTTMVLHATHLDNVLHGLGNQVGRLFDSKTSEPGKAAQYIDAYRKAENLFKQNPSLDISPIVAQQMRTGGRGSQRLITTTTANATMAAMEVKFQKLFPTLSKHDIDVLIKAAKKKIEDRVNQTGGITIQPHVSLKVAGLEQAQIDAQGINVAPMPVSQNAAIALALSTATLNQAKGLAGANDAIIAALRKEIAADEAGAKFQETLIKKKIGSATQHAQEISKLQQDETNAYGQIKSIIQGKKKDFALPMSLQVEQAYASNTSSLTDDVAVAKKITALVSAQIKAGKYKGAALVAAIQELGSAQAVVNAFNIPVKLAIAQAWAATTRTITDDAAVAQKIVGLIRGQIKSGKLKGNALKDALGQLASAQAIARNNFEIPMRLQLQAAKAATTTTTTDDRAVAQATKNFAEAYLKSKKRTVEGMIAAYNAITGANQTLGAGGAATAYEMTSSHKLTAGLGLTRMQRIAEEQRIAQSEAHDGRKPMKGFVGALGFVVNTNPGGSPKAPVTAPSLSDLFSTDARGRSRVPVPRKDISPGATDAHLRPKNVIVRTTQAVIHVGKVTGASDGGGPVTINILGGDTKEVERAVLRALQKGRGLSAPQRRGRNGGHTLGID